MVRFLMIACLFLTLSGLCPAGEFADTMEDELIFLPDDGSAAAGDGLFTVPDGLPPTDGTIIPDGTTISEPYVLVDVPGPAGLAEGMYDRLPRFFGEMNKYDQIAMEPYKDTYDAMDLKQKAEVYAQQFEYMNDRKPRFSPNLLDEIAATSSESADAFAAKRYLYRPPVIKPPKEEPKPIDLGALSGPWAKDEPPAEPAPAEPAPPPVNERGEAIEYYYNTDGTLFIPEDRRMETLRGDWDELWQRRRQALEADRAAEQPTPSGRQTAERQPIGGRLGGVGGLGGLGEVTTEP